MTRRYRLSVGGFADVSEPTPSGLRTVTIGKSTAGMIKDAGNGRFEIVCKKGRKVDRKLKLWEAVYLIAGAYLEDVRLRKMEVAN